MVDYITLGMGGMFAQSEWIFWEAIGLVIGLLGVVSAVGPYHPQSMK
jgi:hypothetical protein